MNRIASIIVLLAVMYPAGAQTNVEQERYTDLIARVEDMPPYVKMYHLLAYQRFHPEHAAVYYRLGDGAYTLLASKDPLHNFAERHELLYKSKLFYGNCLHFLGGKLPRNETFPTIQPAGKRLEYEDVERYLRARIDTIARWRAETDTLHDRFYRMVDAYESSRLLFLSFMEKYPSEKLAHLCLTDEDRQALHRLGVLTAAFEQQKRLFTEALSASPVLGYAPQFRMMPILTYRLDGVTSSDFLANDIPLWDYAGWTTSFLNVQRITYQTLMREIVQEHTMIETGLTRFREGLPIDISPNELLSNRIERYDYHSPLSLFIRLEQLAANTALQAQDSISGDEPIPDELLGGRISAVLEAQQRYDEATTLLRQLRQQVDDGAEKKYAFFLKEAKFANFEQVISYADGVVDFQRVLTHQIEEQLQEYANTHPQQFEDIELPADTDEPAGE